MAGPLDFIGDLFNKDARNRAAKAQHDAIDTYKSIDPNAAITTADQDPYAATNQAGNDAQVQALRQLQGVSSAGGLDPASMARLQQTQMGAAQQARGATDAALQRAQAEGRLNSGRALSAQIQAGQNATNANAMAGAQAAGDASQRALGAMLDTGQLGGQFNTQQQNQAQGQQQRQEFNATQQNQGAQQNIANQLNRASGVAQQDQAIAGTDIGRAKEAKESAGAMGQAAVDAAAIAKMSDERVKENIRRLSIEAMPGVPFATWKWKPGFEDSGPPVGVIAQDLQKVAPHLVHRGPDGFLRVDYSFLGG